MTEATTAGEPAVAELEEPTLERYFRTFNAGQFEATAQLFHPDGVLQPPLDDPQAGRTAIAAYLNAEAQGMQAYPRQATLEASDGHGVRVGGYVQTPLLGVNVAWVFSLLPDGQIARAEIKLLASLQALFERGAAPTG